MQATAAADDHAISLSNLAKTYRGKVHALRGVSMAVGRGEVFGLLGPNGAGKSTLIKILMTVIRRSGGTGTLLGEPVGTKAVLGKIGYLPEHHRFPPYLTGAQAIDFVGGLHGLDKPERKKRCPELLDLVGMTEWANKKIGGYSKGMRQRIGIAQALVNDPAVVFLDEPTDGVDPQGRRDIRMICQRLKDEQRTVFLNSHLLSELEMVCDRVAILVQGTVSRQGTVDELVQGRERYEINILPPPPSNAGQASAGVLAEALPIELAEHRIGEPAPHDELAPPTSSPLARRVGLSGTLPTGEAVEVDHSTVRVSTADPQRVQGLIDAIRAKGLAIRTVNVHRPTLEDLFMEAITDQTTGQELRPGAAKSKGAAQ